MACEDCEVDDVVTAVGQCIVGKPVKYDWCPQPAVVAQIARDIQARREHPPVEAIEAPDPVVSEGTRLKATERWEALRETFGKTLTHEEWVKSCLAYGTIK